MMRFIRSALVIARRDFAATVLSKTFIFFLLGPLFPVLFGGIFGSIGAHVAGQMERPVIAVVFPQRDYDRLSSARDELTDALSGDIVRLAHFTPERDLATQEKRLLARRNPPVRAVLSGDLAHPQLTGALAGDASAVGQLRLLIANARSQGVEPAQLPVTNVQVSSGSLAKDRALTAQMSQVALFLLTLMLSTMVLSQLIEEKSNKVIEIIAAAIPIDAMFVGKLFAMLAASILGLLVWITAGAVLVQMISHGGIRSLPTPASRSSRHRH